MGPQESHTVFFLFKSCFLFFDLILALPKDRVLSLAVSLKGREVKEDERKNRNVPSPPQNSGPGSCDLHAPPLNVTSSRLTCPQRSVLFCQAYLGCLTFPAAFV